MGPAESRELGAVPRCREAVFLSYSGQVNNWHCLCGDGTSSGGLTEALLIAIQSSGKRGKFRTLIRWHTVASWTWGAQDETRGICKMTFDGFCPDCRFPGDDCPLRAEMLSWTKAPFT